MFACLLPLVVGGCGELPQEPAVIPPERAARVAGEALDLSLKRPPEANSASLANLLGSYTGGNRRRQALVLVFDSPAATDQVTGGGRRGGVAGSVTVVERNVVVLYRGRDARIRRPRVSAALRGTSS